MKKNKLISLILTAIMTASMLPSINTKADAGGSGSPQVTINGRTYDATLSNPRTVNGNTTYDVYVKIPDCNTNGNLDFTSADNESQQIQSQTSSYSGSQNVSLSYNGQTYNGTLNKQVDVADGSSPLADITKSDYKTGKYDGSVYKYVSPDQKTLIIKDYLYNKDMVDSSGNLLQPYQNASVSAKFNAVNGGKLDIGRAIVKSSGTDESISMNAIDGVNGNNDAFLVSTDGTYSISSSTMRNNSSQTPDSIEPCSKDTFVMLNQAAFQQYTFPNIEAWEWRTDGRQDINHAPKIGNTWFTVSPDTTLSNVKVKTTNDPIYASYYDVSTDIYLSNGSMDNAKAALAKLPSTITRNMHAFSRNSVSYSVGGNTFSPVSGSPMDASDFEIEKNKLQENDYQLSNLLSDTGDKLGSVTYKKPSADSACIRWLSKTASASATDLDKYDSYNIPKEGYYLRLTGRYHYGACYITHTITGSIAINHYVGAIHYAGTVTCNGGTSQPTQPTQPTTGDYTLNISYVDEDTDKTIADQYTKNCEKSKGYEDRDLTTGNNGIKWTVYTPTTAPSGYTFDTSKYHDGDNGYRIMFNFPNSYYSMNGIGTGNTADLKVYCKSGGPVNPTPDPTPTPVITTGTVVERYFVAGVHKDMDDYVLTNVDQGIHTYYCYKTYDGYTCVNPSTTVNVTAGGITYADFYFNKNSTPPTAYIYGPDTAHQGSQFTLTGSGYDPQGESLTYYWKTSDGQTITGTQGTLKMGDKPITVTLYVTDTEGLSSTVVSKTINPKNNPPTVILNLPETITLGDDLNVNAVASDSDGDAIKYTWNTPDGMTGTVKDNGGTVQFMNKDDVGKKKTFTVTVDDGFGGTATATAVTTVIAPKPTVLINQGGILKENRKVILSETSNGGSKSFPIDNSKTQWSFYDSNNNPMNVTNTADSGIVESLDSTTGTSNMNVIFTKPGTYKVQCKVINTNGDTAVDTKTIIITPDLVPTADFNVPQVVLRDPNNNNLATTTITDNSSSQDGDIIDKRVWFYCFDSNNNGNDEDDVWYVFENGSWRQFGTYADVKALLNNQSGLDAINSGNLTTVKLIPQNFNNNGQMQSHVGDYYYKEIVRESFGQDTIQNLVSIKDYKVNIR